MPKTVDHEAYRKELLEKCFDLFGRKGFSNVTMRQMAQEIGVSTGALYHYFPTKVDVLEQLFSWAVEEDIEAYTESEEQDPPLEEKVERISHYWASRGPFYEHLLLLALDLFRQSPAEGEKVFADFVDHYKAAISTNLGADDRATEVIVSCLLGSVVHSLLTPRHFSFTDHMRALPAVLLTIIAGGKAKASDAPAFRRAKGHVEHVRSRSSKKVADA